MKAAGLDVSGVNPDTLLLYPGMTLAKLATMFITRSCSCGSGSTFSPLVKQLVFYWDARGPSYITHNFGSSYVLLRERVQIRLLTSVYTCGLLSGLLTRRREVIQRRLKLRAQSWTRV